MKFTIVTPCHNRATYLDATIESVVAQKGDFSLQYIIQNAGTDPEVRQCLDRWSSDLNSGRVKARCHELKFEVYHEKDTGMYDGLNRGFAKATGEILAWINSDDLYHPGAFQCVADVLRFHDSIYWLTGIPNSFNRYGCRTGFDSFPKAYSREFIRRGLYRVENTDCGLNWIAQDCCFWRSSLWQLTEGRLDSSLRWAADFKLWRTFAEHCDLVKVNSFLGGYRFHGDQVTGDPTRYLCELPLLTESALPLGWRSLHKWLSAHPDDARLFYNPEQGRPWLEGFGLEWEWLVGRVVRYDFGTERWDIQLSPIL